MLAAVVCGILCGNRGYSQLVEWLHDLPVAVWHWMGYTRRPPKLDCFRDLLTRLDPAVLEAVVSEWTGRILGPSFEQEGLSGVSLDGKTLCGTLRPFARAVHLLAAVDHRTGCVLSQCRVDEKTNEPKAARDLLRTLVLDGRVVVGDAIFCQRDVCRQIVDARANYFLTVKGNQPTLLREISLELMAPDGAPQKTNSPPSSSGSAVRSVTGRRRSTRATGELSVAR